MSAWDKLPDEYKVMLDTACKMNIAYLMSEGEAEQPTELLANQADGVQITDWTDEQLAEFRKAWEVVLEEELAASEDIRRLWDRYSTFSAQYKIWGDRAYLK